MYTPISFYFISSLGVIVHTSWKNKIISNVFEYESFFIEMNPAQNGRHMNTLITYSFLST